MASDSKLNAETSMWDWITDDLRFYMKKSGMTGAKLAEVLHRDPSSIYNMLDGRRRMQYRDAEILDKLWDLNQKFTRQLQYAVLDSHREWFGEYVEHEAIAKIIKTFEALSVPGLLQTPEYAGELAASLGSPDVQRQVERRMARQKILYSKSPPSIWVLITQNVIDWPIGGSEVMRNQLAHLLEMVSMPNIGLRVVPRSAGAHAGVDGSFSIIYGETTIAYTESPGRGRLVPSEPEVLNYSNRYDRIGQVALPEKSSLEMIELAMEAL